MTEEACTWSKHCAYFRSIAAMVWFKSDILLPYLKIFFDGRWRCLFLRFLHQKRAVHYCPARFMR